MRHVLIGIVRAVVPEADRVALLGDLEEDYRRRVRPTRGWLGAEAWYAGQLIAALAYVMRDRMSSSPMTASPRAPLLRRLFAGTDVRQALRRWRHRPGFAVTAIVTLALGIGATTAIFSVVDAVLLTPPPWPDADRLVAVHAVFPNRRQNPSAALTWNRGSVSYPGWDALRADRVFDEVAAWRRISLDSTFGEARTDLVQTMDVSSNLLPLLGVGLVHGRYFNDQEDRHNSDSVILTHEAWRRRFGGRADIVGQPVILGSARAGGRDPKTVVGVLERGFGFDGDPVPEVLLPVGISAESGRRYPSSSLRVVARLRPGVPVETAASAAAAILRTAEREEPTSARVLLLADDHLRGAARPLWVLFGGAGLLLLVACSNVAGLLLGEARARRHEIAVRLALGGSRARVVRQLLVEHGLLAVAGAAAGLALAYWLIKACVALAPAALPHLGAVTLDARVAGFALGLGVVTLLLFGIAPAVALATTSAARALAEGGRDSASTRHRGQRIVVAAEIALALVLLVGASLLGETLFRLTSRPLGFNPKNLAVVSFRMTRLPNVPEAITAEAYKALTPAQHQERDLFFAGLRTTGWWLHMSAAIDRLAALPGVTGVAGGYTAPFLGVRTTAVIRPSGRPETDAVATRQHAVSERYFETMGMRILRGRNFEPRDRRGPAAAGFIDRSLFPATVIPTVISQELERRFFGGDGLGKQIIQGSSQASRTLSVVGVVPDTRWRKTDDDDWAAFYVLGESYHGINTFLIRTAGDPLASLAAIRHSLGEYDPSIVVIATATMEDLVARSMAEERFRAALSVLFGGAALILAAVGLYGLAARRVADRRREIGVRVALGARPGDVRSLIMADALRTLALGLGIGLPAAFAASQITRTLLFGVTPTAPHVFVLAACVLGAAALGATLLPARRAAAIDPIRVLKE